MVDLTQIDLFLNEPDATYRISFEFGFPEDITEASAYINAVLGSRVTSSGGNSVVYTTHSIPRHIIFSEASSDSFFHVKFFTNFTGWPGEAETFELLPNVIKNYARCNFERYIYIPRTDGKKPDFIEEIEPIPTDPAAIEQRCRRCERRLVCLLYGYSPGFAHRGIKLDDSGSRVKLAPKCVFERL